MNIQQIDKEIEELNRKKQEILAKQEIEKNKGEWINIEKGLEINTKQQFNGKTYSECEELARENNWEIADYPLLQKLRNAGLEWLKDFWVFVPNPDERSKNSNYVAGFSASSAGAGLDCYGNPTYSSSGLGVFVIRKKIKEKNERSN